MSDTVIRVENLSKRYVLGGRANGTARYDTFRDALARAVRRPFARLRPSSILDPLSSSASDFWALRDVSFEVKRGEVLGIIGRNGAGKSTLLKILSRITEPTAGRVAVRGRVASLLEVGTGFHPELSGRENIFLNGVILGMTGAEVRARFDEIVAFAEVEQFLDTPVKHYSSGMYVRLAFAVAAHLEPEILIVDEVLAVGDSEFQKKCLGKMRTIGEGGRTVLLVSHQLGVIRDLCTRAVLLRQGRVAIVGNAGAAVDAYLTSSRTSEAAAASRYVETVIGRSSEVGADCFFGEKLAFEIGLHRLPEHPIGVNVAFRNESGRLICLFSSNPHDGVALPRKEAFRVNFEMDPCCLAPGGYTLDLAVADPGVHMIEEVSAAARFTVHPKRVRGSWAYEAKFGDCFPPHRWIVGSTADVQPT